MNKGPYVAVSVATSLAAYLCGIFFYNEMFAVQVMVGGIVAMVGATLAFISLEFKE